jgi:uncharacterized protein YggE
MPGYEAMVALAGCLRFTAVICLLAGIAAAPLAAQERPPRDEITVSGQGEVKLVPDAAKVRAGVVTDGKTAREAGEANARIMAAVVAALKAAGIADKDMQTRRYALQPVHASSGYSGRGRISGFQATNSVAVTVHDLARLAEIVDRATESGANDIGGIEFVVTGPSKALDAAREEAVADARRKAEIFARAAGVTLGRPIAIVETGAGPGQPIAFARGAGKSSPTPILPGETVLHVTISVTFELSR